MSDNFNDIVIFYEKFGLTRPDVPQFLDQETMDFRINFLIEELEEIKLGYKNKDIAEVADGLIDLTVVAMGTAYLMGLPWNWMWDEVLRANLAKERVTHAGESKRGSSLDLKKPECWRPPDIEGCLMDSGWIQQELCGHDGGGASQARAPCVEFRYLVMGSRKNCILNAVNPVSDGGQTDATLRMRACDVFEES